MRAHSYYLTNCVGSRMGATMIVWIALRRPSKSCERAADAPIGASVELKRKTRGLFAAASAIATAVHTPLPRGILIQVGVAGDTPLPINAIVAKEIKFQGTYRFHDEFSEAVAAIASGDIDVSPMITGVYQLDVVQQAFEAAMDRRRSVKVHLKFN